MEDQVPKRALHRLLAPMRTSTSTLLQQARLKMVLNKETRCYKARKTVTILQAGIKSKKESGAKIRFPFL